MRCMACRQLRGVRGRDSARRRDAAMRAAAAIARGVAGGARREQLPPTTQGGSSGDCLSRETPRYIVGRYVRPRTAPVEPLRRGGLGPHANHIGTHARRLRGRTRAGRHPQHAACARVRRDGRADTHPRVPSKRETREVAALPREGTRSSQAAATYAGEHARACVHVGIRTRKSACSHARGHLGPCMSVRNNDPMMRPPTRMGFKSHWEGAGHTGGCLFRGPSTRDPRSATALPKSGTRSPIATARTVARIPRCDRRSLADLARPKAALAAHPWEASARPRLARGRLSSRGVRRRSPKAGHVCGHVTASRMTFDPG